MNRTKIDIQTWLRILCCFICFCRITANSRHKHSFSCFIAINLESSILFLSFTVLTSFINVLIASIESISVFMFCCYLKNKKYISNFNFKWF